MSDEPENLINDIFITKCGVKYPFVRSTGVNEKYGIRFFPSVYCITPDGQILTVPDDRMPAEAMIEEQLKNVSLVPKLPADSRFDVLRGFWEKREHKKLADYLDKMLAQDGLDAELRTIYDGQRTELGKRGERAAARIAGLGKGPDYAEAQAALEKIAKDWKGLPPAEAAQKELARFGKDPAIQKELTAGKALAKLLEKFDATKSSQRRKLIEELMELSKKYSGTTAAAKAQQLRVDLASKSD